MVVQAFNITLEMLGVPAVVFEVKPFGRFVYLQVNQAAEAHYGYSADKIVGHDLTNFEGLSESRINQRKIVIGAFKQCVVSKEPVFYESKTRRPDGEDRWGRSMAAPLLDARGVVQHLLSTKVDVTELIELKTIIDTFGAPVTVFDVSPGPRFTWSTMNKASEKYFGWSNREYNGREFDEGNDEFVAQRKLTIMHLIRCVTTKKPVFDEAKYQLFENRHIWMRSSLVPIFDEMREVRQIMVTTTDVTDLIETQKRLESALTHTLSGFVKICAKCKNIRHEDEWQPIEQYAAEQMDYHEFSHGMCAECAKELYGDDILDP